MKKHLLFGLFLLVLPFIGLSQKKLDSKITLIQFSGVVVSSDSLQPIPYAAVTIHKSGRGTITDFYGFFSFVAKKGDTIDFHYVGYKPMSFIIPDSLKEDRYSLIQVLKRDTILLKEAVVYPWPSKEEFKRAFLELKIPDDDLKRAEKNIQLAEIKTIQEQVPYDGAINYQYQLQQQQSKLYSAGQYPKNNLFNPIAWAAFIKAWKDGTLKKQEDPKIDK
ncbi:MAG: carboxypeptidase-like regulatory domain-containing protein [Bacteroidota bacterium]